MQCWGLVCLPMGVKEERKIVIGYNNNGCSVWRIMVFHTIQWTLSFRSIRMVAFHCRCLWRPNMRFTNGHMLGYPMYVGVVDWLIVDWLMLIVCWHCTLLMVDITTTTLLQRLLLPLLFRYLEHWKRRHWCLPMWNIVVGLICWIPLILLRNGCLICTAILQEWQPPPVVHLLKSSRRPTTTHTCLFW